MFFSRGQHFGEAMAHFDAIAGDSIRRRAISVSLPR
jgi:hypothetical protein